MVKMCMHSVKSKLNFGQKLKKQSRVTLSWVLCLEASQSKPQTLSWRASNRKRGVVCSQTELAPEGKPKASSVMGRIANHRSETHSTERVTAGLQKIRKASSRQQAGRQVTVVTNDENSIKSIMTGGEVSLWSQGKVVLFNNRLTRQQRFRGGSEGCSSGRSVEMARFGVQFWRESEVSAGQSSRRQKWPDLVCGVRTNKARYEGTSTPPLHGCPHTHTHTRRANTPKHRNEKLNISRLSQAQTESTGYNNYNYSYLLCRQSAKFAKDKIMQGNIKGCSFRQRALAKSTSHYHVISTGNHFQ